MIVTSMQLTISSRRDIAVLQKESSSLEGEEDVKTDLSFTYTYRLLTRAAIREFDQDKRVRRRA